MTFTVRWPDGAVQRCYSPSLVVHDHLSAGADYAVPEFVARVRRALTEASDRVRAARGTACSAAAAQLAQVEARAAAFAPGSPAVRVLALKPPLPRPSPATPEPPAGALR